MNNNGVFSVNSGVSKAHLTILDDYVTDYAAIEPSDESPPYGHDNDNSTNSAPPLTNFAIFFYQPFLQTSSSPKTGPPVEAPISLSGYSYFNLVISAIT